MFMSPRVLLLFSFRWRCTLLLSVLCTAFRPHPRSLSKGEGGQAATYLFNFRTDNLSKICVMEIIVNECIFINSNVQKPSSK